MYEQDWFHKGLCIANDLIGHDNLYFWEHLREIRGDLLNWHYSTISELYDGSDDTPYPIAQRISDIVNNGVSLINYCAHGSTTEWETSRFSIDEVFLLENDDKLPFVFSCACLNGRFSIPNQTTFAEAWLRATNAVTNRPTGAIGFYGASQRIPLMFDQIQDEFNKHLIMEEYITLGACVIMPFLI